MFFVAAVLAILSDLFYAAGHHEIGSLGVAMYGSPFCNNPVLALVAAGWLRAGADSSACADALVRKLADFGDGAVMPVICPTCQTSRVKRRALLWRRVHRMNGLRHRRLKLHLQFGRHGLGTGCTPNEIHVDFL